MTRKFIKKPLEIEAFRFGFEEIPYWGSGKFSVHRQPNPDEDYLLINTLEGQMKANVGDFVIKGIKGEMYPCKADIFLATYDEVPCPYIARVDTPFDCKIWTQPPSIIPGDVNA